MRVIFEAIYVSSYIRQVSLSHVEEALFVLWYLCLAVRIAQSFVSFHTLVCNLEIVGHSSDLGCGEWLLRRLERQLSWRLPRKYRDLVNRNSGSKWSWGTLLTLIYKLLLFSKVSLFCDVPSPIVELHLTVADLFYRYRATLILEVQCCFVHCLLW